MKKSVVFALGGALEASFFPYRLARLQDKFWIRSFVALSPKAERFVSPLSLAAISENEVYTETEDFDTLTCRPKHLTLSEAEVLVVSPATPRIIVDAASGRISCPVTRLIAYFDSQRIVVAPKIHSQIASSVYETHLQTLADRGCHIIKAKKQVSSEWLSVETYISRTFLLTQRT